MHIHFLDLELRLWKVISSEVLAIRELRPTGREMCLGTAANKENM